MMRIGYRGVFTVMFILAACSRSGPADDSLPIMTVAATSTVELSPTPDPSTTAPAVVNTETPLLCDAEQDENAAAFAAKVIELANIERAKVNAAPLAEQAQLTQAAQAHAMDMACNLFMSHTGSDGSSPFDRMTRFGYLYSAAAENVAAGYHTPEDVVKGWMGSPGHRANMLNPDYTEIGIGFVFNTAGPLDGTYSDYWVMTLGRPQ